MKEERETEKVGTVGNKNDAAGGSAAWQKWEAGTIDRLIKMGRKNNINL